MAKSNTLTIAQDIRKTKKYLLYQGYGNMANKYSIIRYPQIYGETIMFLTNWITDIHKDELMKHEDDADFDKACSKLDYS
jgi:hypothetical protein